MPEQTTGYMTLTVLSSSTLARPDGRAAILLETKEQGAIAFEVDQHAIDTLRKELAVAETHLRRSKTGGKPN